MDANLFEVLAREADELEKAEDLLFKSDILHVLEHGGNVSIKYGKTGKEIKKKVNDTLLPKLSGSLSANEIVATGQLQGCGAAPTKEVPTWWTADVHLDTAWRIFDWDQCRVARSDQEMVQDGLFSDKIKASEKEQCAATPEQAQCRSDYNETVRKIVNILTDMKALEILRDNVRDDETVRLSTRQLVVLGFVDK